MDYSKEDIEELRNLFAYLDKDNSGYISKENLEQVIRSLKRNVSEIEIHDLIQEVDTNENGQIELSEFISFMEHEYKRRNINDEVMKTFQSFDVDNSGYITADNLMVALTRLGDKPSEAEIQRMISVADIKGDGRIDYEEFKRMLQQKKL